VAGLVGARSFSWPNSAETGAPMLAAKALDQLPLGNRTARFNQ
jgi:hypothetical protein